ncbi:MAG: hypothetical protein JAY99_18755 [Candidatus Thiodiazotropha lotti]|uniref:Uncharacterized protein n=1 Tax=Candidatus Thiodiazotropha endoloripes TaxID=1818881 RepID=A0A1E2UQU9_9GAMM|nr:hypothetical protein [Candidatus Thiodiazotropha endoloripes]MCG7989961.1 hypothetical protein [Candidatus Thiodiazotropha lotti]MCW4181613.1 hypothetical protein [Candidatus Thiodiazotropha weberae]MCG8001558.1 hypothetical protein [Candidatus Thiodiazotropha lotti]MCW4193332.1 hypothetical protein [Candidatus Thiodiazotropha weberae]ODB97138.1 hypothetical protein A3196_10425 [Candidatus Thiodiazotropha endoloripes]
MLEDLKKKKTLSDRALELVMRDVMSGLMDVSMQLGKECLETSSAEILLTSHDEKTEAIRSGKKSQQK